VRLSFEQLYLRENEYGGAGAVPVEVHGVGLVEALVGDDLVLLEVGILVDAAYAGRTLRPRHVGHHVNSAQVPGHAEVRHLHRTSLQAFGSGSALHPYSQSCRIRIQVYKVGVNFEKESLVGTSVPDPDPDPPGSEIIWPQGSGSEIINFGSGSGSCSGSGSSPFSHQT